MRKEFGFAGEEFGLVEEEFEFSEKREGFVEEGDEFAGEDSRKRKRILPGRRGREFAEEEWNSKSPGRREEFGFSQVGEEFGFSQVEEEEFESRHAV